MAGSFVLNATEVKREPFNEISLGTRLWWLSVP